ncbi:MAG: hypothetical protein WC666_04970 [Candidatus Paceibacterota bacterium]|jgi:hypothetical protein
MTSENATVSNAEEDVTIAVGKDPTEGQRERGRKLAYVCFSRAESDLRITLFTPNPTQARIAAQIIFTSKKQIGTSIIALPSSINFCYR